MPTLQDVMDCFDSLGSPVTQPMPLILSLKNRGFRAEAVASAIQEAIQSGTLMQTETGGLQKVSDHSRRHVGPAGGA